MTTETKIREAFEAWITDFSDGEASIEMNGDEYADYATNCMWEGYKAAMASLEQAIWIQSNHIDCAKKGPFLSRTGPQKMQSDWVPLYRIKEQP